MEKTLNIEIKEGYDNQPHLIIVLSGALSDMSAYDFKSNLDQLINETHRDCVIDISKISDLDIIGINVLITTHLSLSRQGRQLTVVSQKESPADRLFHLTRMDKILNLKRA